MNRRDLLCATLGMAWAIIAPKTAIASRTYPQSVGTWWRTIMPFEDDGRRIAPMPFRIVFDGYLFPDGCSFHWNEETLREWVAPAGHNLVDLTYRCRQLRNDGKPHKSFRRGSLVGLYGEWWRLNLVCDECYPVGWAHHVPLGKSHVERIA